MFPAPTATLSRHWENLRDRMRLPHVRRRNVGVYERGCIDSDESLMWGDGGRFKWKGRMW